MLLAIALPIGNLLQRFLPCKSDSIVKTIPENGKLVQRFAVEYLVGVPAGCPREFHVGATRIVVVSVGLGSSIHT